MQILGGLRLHGNRDLATVDRRTPSFFASASNVNRYSISLIIGFLLLTWQVSGCVVFEPNDENSDGDYNAPGDMDDGDSAGSSDCSIDPDADSDDDGLLDIYEDLNRNCIVDAGETDPYNPDTDGDGLLDGDEDADGNGVWDQELGELNPLMLDTDGNGIPDDQEPKAQVCNRAHASAVLAERLILPGGRAFYAHPSIAAEITGFENTNALLLRNQDAGQIGILFETKSRLNNTLDQILSTLSAQIGVPQLNGADIETLMDVNENVAQIRIPLTAAPVLQDWMGALTTIAPELAYPISLDNRTDNEHPDESGDESDNGDVPQEEMWGVMQLTGTSIESGSAWTLTWSPKETEHAWVRRISPSLISAKEHQVVRFVCENVARTSHDTLRIVIATQEESAPAIRAQWLDAIQITVGQRAKRGLETEIYVLQEKEHQQRVWTKTAPQDVIVDASIPSHEQPFWQIVDAAIPTLPTVQDGHVATVLLLIGADFPNRDESGDVDYVPPAGNGQRLEQLIWVTGYVDSESCLTRVNLPSRSLMPHLRNTQTGVLWNACGEHAESVTSKNVITSWAYGRWSPTVRDAIASTLRIADKPRDMSVDAHRVPWSAQVISTNQDDLTLEDSAVSFASWYSKE